MCVECLLEAVKRVEERSFYTQLSNLREYKIFILPFTPLYEKDKLEGSRILLIPIHTNRRLLHKTNATQTKY